MLGEFGQALSQGFSSGKAPGTRLELSHILARRNRTIISTETNLACVAWRFLSNLRGIGKRESRDKERQSREEPGRETTEKPPARMAGIFC